MLIKGNVNVYNIIRRSSTYRSILYIQYNIYYIKRQRVFIIIIYQYYNIQCL